MRLYRGQPTQAAVEAAALRRPAWLAAEFERRRDEPMLRAAGRWFTDDPEIARWYADDANGASEIVTVEIDDAIAETFRVSVTPVTTCGLTPGAFSRDPEREFLIPREIACLAEPV
jgi:hypothetical protein